MSEVEASPVFAAPDEARRRVEVARRAVVERFGTRVLGLPGLHVARVSDPAPAPLETDTLNYWWQAHYLHAHVDAATRLMRDGRVDECADLLADGRAILRGLRWRNGFRYTNSYYDDMAWLALAIRRMGAVLEAATGMTDRATELALDRIHAQLMRAHTPELGGGLWWNTKRDFKNTPASAPAGLHFALRGETEAARSIATWLRTRLWDEESQLTLDGIRVGPDGAEVLEGGTYTYNQALTLGLALELGEPDDLEWAGELIEGMANGLAFESPWGLALRGHGNGDGGLFSGVAARYLASAALDARLPMETRELAAEVLYAAAEGLWEGRAYPSAEGWPAGRSRRMRRKQPEVIPNDGFPVFSLDPLRPAADTVDHERIDLTPQLQAWLIFEAVTLLASS